MEQKRFVLAFLCLALSFPLWSKAALRREAKSASGFSRDHRNIVGVSTSLAPQRTAFIGWTRPACSGLASGLLWACSSLALPCLKLAAVDQGCAPARIGKMIV